MSTVALQRHDGWLEVRIDREARRNALDRATRRALLDAVTGALADMRVIVLTGTGTSFCAGLDLKQRASELEAGHSDTAADEAIEVNMALRDYPGVTIAAVNGYAYGGGVTLVNSCDLALAADDATFACPEIAGGGYASMAGPTSRLLLTRKRAAWLLLANQPLDAATAERWGLVNQVVPAPQLMSRVRELAARIAGHDTTALIETRRALDRLPLPGSGPDDWRAAMVYGQTVSAAIRARRN